MPANTLTSSRSIVSSEEVNGVNSLEINITDFAIDTNTIWETVTSAVVTVVTTTSLFYCSNLSVISCRPYPSSAASATTTSFHQQLESTTYYRASLAVWKCVPPFLLVLGTVGNILTIWVLSSTAMTSSSAIMLYFKALAVSDLCLLYSGLLRNWIKYLFSLEIRDTHPAVCKIHIWMVYVTGMTSAWFLVAMTLQRALSVVWPYRMVVMRSRKTAVSVLVVIIVLSCFLNAHNLYGYDLVYDNDSAQYYCDYLNPEYEYFARSSWPWIDMSVSSLVPFFLLIGNNSLLMWKIASSVSDVRKLTSTGNNQEPASQRKKMSNSLNLTLICLSAMFLILTLPINAYLVMDHFFHYDLDKNPATDLAWAVTNNLWYTNSAINFYVYILSGSKFRQQVWRCLRVVFETKKPAQNLRTLSESESAKSTCPNQTEF